MRSGIEQCDLINYTSVRLVFQVLQLVLHVLKSLEFKYNCSPDNTQLCLLSLIRYSYICIKW